MSKRKVLEGAFEGAKIDADGACVLSAYEKNSLTGNTEYPYIFTATFDGMQFNAEVVGVLGRRNCAGEIRDNCLYVNGQLIRGWGDLYRAVYI